MAALTTAGMIQRVKDRTHSRDDLKIIGEINSAKDWASNKLFNSEGGPDSLSTHATQLTISSRTREYDLGANVTGTIYGVKQMWLKLSTDTDFVLMVPLDSSDPRFVANDPYPSSDTTTVAEGHPVYYDVINFSQLRFAPPLPADCTLRADFFRKPPTLDPVTNNALAYGDDIVEPLHEAIVDKATAQMFVNQNDDNVFYWEGQAKEKARDAFYLIRSRTPGPVRTQPFRRRRRSA